MQILCQNIILMSSFTFYAISSVFLTQCYHIEPADSLGYLTNAPRLEPGLSLAILLPKEDCLWLLIVHRKCYHTWLLTQSHTPNWLLTPLWQQASYLPARVWRGDGFVSHSVGPVCFWDLLRAQVQHLVEDIRTGQWLGSEFHWFLPGETGGAGLRCDLGRTTERPLIRERGWRRRGRHWYGLNVFVFPAPHQIHMCWYLEVAPLENNWV